MENLEIINNLIIKALKNKIEPNFKNIMFLSLTSSGGTITEEEETKKFLKDNLFTFIDGYIFIDELNNIVYFNDKSRKIEEDRTYTYRILKSKVKAAQGAKGFKKFVSDNSRIGNLWFRTINNIILEIS